MAANVHYSGAAVSDFVIKFDKPIGHMLVWVDAGVTFSISFDSGDNFINLDPGNHQFPIGLTTRVHITSDGNWDLVGVQS